MTQTVKPEHTVRTRAQAREQVRENMVRWYILTSGKLPECQCEKEMHGPNGKMLVWFLDPPIPGVDNPVVIEESLGGGENWSIRTERRVF